MRKRTLTLALLCICCGSVALNAANVKVTMNNVSKTMSLVSESTGEAVDAGTPSGMVYSFDVPAGKYELSGIAADGKTINGTIGITVAEKSEPQEFKIITCTVYATNDKNTWTVENGDYTLDVKVTSREGESQSITLGNSVTAGRHTFLAHNGNSYYVAMIPGKKRESEGYTTLYKSGTLTANVNVSGAIPKGENYTVSVPLAAEFRLNMKFSHFDDFTPVEPIAVENFEGVKKLTYYISQGQVYNFRSWIPGKLTRAGYFTMSADAAKRPALEFTESDYDHDPSAFNHDPKSNEGYETGGIFININERGHLLLEEGEKFKLHSMRTWEISDNSTNNYFMEPDFHYRVINLDGKPSSGVVEISSKPGSAWAELKAVGKGEAIVLVTYDALGVNYYTGAEKKPYMGGELWGAIWPENTAAFVVSVGCKESLAEPKMLLNEKYNMNTLRLAGNNVDAEHDVFYYLDNEEGANYSFKPSNVAEVTMAYPTIGERMVTYTGFGKEGVTLNADGSYTLLLRHGRQIVKLTDNSGNSVYQVITAKRCHREIINVSRPGSRIFQPGDQVKIQYSGLFHPANKIAGIYNMSAYVTYNGIPNGTSLILGAGQYTFASVASAQAVTIDIPADHNVEAGPQVIMNEGVIQVNGYGDPIGNHRNIDDVAGRSPNFTAVPHKTYFGTLPDVAIPLSAVRNFRIKTVCNIEGADIKLSFDGMTLAPDQDGYYSGTYGTYDIVAVKNGYRCFRASYQIGDDAEGLQTFEIAMTEADDAWDGKTKTKPEIVENVYQISKGSELAWLAANVNESGTAVRAKVVNDIDLGDFEWTPVGISGSKAFTGSFDGAGHIVKGLYVNNEKTQYQGLFGYVKGSSAERTSIRGVTVEGTVRAKAYAGGLAGYVAGDVDIDRCVSLVDVTGSGNNLGGIAGYSAVNTSIIKNCYNKGRITGAGNCGGIVGGHSSKGVKVENVFNLGEIVCQKNAGACVGSSYTKEGLKNVFAVSEYDRSDHHTLVTPEQMASGEIAYRLGEAFGQEIGKEKHPVIGGKTVLYDSKSGRYYNESDISSADELKTENAEPETYYNIEGIPSSKPYRGLNIVKMSDGSVRKLPVR